MRSEDQRCRRSVGREALQEFSAASARILGLGGTRFFRQCVAVQPIEQRVSEAAENADLRVMDMGIDETGEYVTAAQGANAGCRVRLTDIGIATEIRDPSVLQHQPAIFENLERALIAK